METAKIQQIPQMQGRSQKVQQNEKAVRDVTFDQVLHKTMDTGNKNEPVSEQKESCENEVPEEMENVKAEEEPSTQEPAEKAKESQPKLNYEAVQMLQQAEVIPEVVPEVHTEAVLPVSTGGEKILEQEMTTVSETTQNQAAQPMPKTQQNADMAVVDDFSEKITSGKQTEAAGIHEAAYTLTEEKGQGIIRGEQPAEMEILKPYEQPVQSQTTETNMAEELKEQAEVLKSMVQKPAVVKEQDTEKSSGKPADVDKVQQQVDNKMFWNPQEALLRNITGNNRSQFVDTKDVKESMPIPEQLTKGISQGISKGLQMFSIRLKPEGMGEVMVHLASAGGRIAMSIGVTNTETQKMLNSEMANLKEMLKPLNAEVKEVYQSGHGGLDMTTYEQNFYQQQRQQYYSKLQSARQVKLDGMEVEEVAMHEETARSAAYVNGNLNAYV